MLAHCSKLQSRATEEAAVTEILLLATRQGALLAWNMSARAEGLLCSSAASTCTLVASMY